jgi:signal transduction histidine kinase
MLRDIPLRARIVLGILFCGLIPLFIVSLVSFNAARTELKKQAFRQLQSVRDIKITVLQKFYFERRADVRVFAANPYIRQAYEALNGPDARAARDRYAPFLKALIREYEYRDLFLLRPDDGTIVYSNSGEAAPGNREKAALPQGLEEAWRVARGGELGISDLRLEPGPEAAPAQYLAAPIQSGSDTVAVVAVQLAPDAIELIARERSGLGSTGVTFLVGPDGRLRAPLRSVRNSLDAETAKRAAEAVKGRDFAAETDPQARPEASAAGDAIIARANATRVLSSSAPVRIQGLPWTMYAEIDESEIDGQIARALNRRLALLIGLSTVLLAALAFLIARGLGRGVRGVIEELHRLVRDVLAGRLSSRARADAMTADFRPVLAEINALIEAFEKQIELSSRLEGHIRDAQRLEVIGSLAGGIAHDFNNLLAHMRALAHILEDEARRDGRDPARLEDMKLAIRRGTDLVQQILTFSRPGQDQKRIVDLCASTAESLRLVRTALPANITLIYASGDDPLPVSGDPSQIHQIVMNLCVNAIQAMQGAGGRLTVGLTVEEIEAGAGDEPGSSRYARLRVEDTGPGMSEDVRRRIFEPFFTTKAPGQGSGLGLSVVAGIVMSLGGTIEAESLEGKGARFDVILPLA